MTNPMNKKFAALCLATAIAGTGITISQNAAWAEPARPVAAERVQQAAPRTTVDQDASRYAEREQAAEKQQAYQGGNYIVIGISTTAAIVAVVLLLLLL